jgi:hypothetical protein
VTGDVAAHIGERNTGLLAERGDERLVQVGYSYSGKANEKEKIEEFCVRGMASRIGTGL